MEELENLVKIKQFKKEPADQSEFDGMVLAATTKLKDVSIPGLSLDSQFSLAYGAAHKFIAGHMLNGKTLCQRHDYKSDLSHI